MSDLNQAQQAVWQWLDHRFSLTDTETEELQRLLETLERAANPWAHLAQPEKYPAGSGPYGF